MNPIFSVGIQSLWDELRHMPAGGVWWINADREQDAIDLMNQTLMAQPHDAKVAVAGMGHALRQIIKLEQDHGPDKIRLFSMPNHEKGLYYFTRDLLCSIEPEHYLLVLLCANNAWQNISAEKLHGWLKKTFSWAKYHNCSLLIINPANNSDKQSSILMSEYQSLSGMASLRYESAMHLYDVAWWSNEKGVSARQQLQLEQHDGQWRLAKQEETTVQPRSDEKRILSNIDVLEGAPALSEYWTLFPTNEELFNEARTTQAATLVFALRQNNQIESLARQIHTLRRQRGSALKILVRETKASLRATDERLLLGCGANMVIPWNAPLSRCLTLIESVQGQQFNRLVPEDITTLLSMTQPLKLRGYQPWNLFCEAVSNMVNNTLLRASCGQTSHKNLYQTAGEQCYLFDNLTKLGFTQQLMMDHNGVFGGFLDEVRQNGGIQVPLMNQAGLPPVLQSFDGSPVYDDTAVLNRWMESEATKQGQRTATFYNLLPLHDGNHYPGVRQTADYKIRAQKLFDELDAFFTQLEKSGRKVMVVMVPEHGAALQGDKMQVSGLRDIPSPSITHVPTAIKFFGMKSPHQGAPIDITQPSSFLAVSELVARVLDGKIFNEDNVNWDQLTSGLPQTAPVSENANAVVIQYQNKPYVRLNGGDWVPYPQ